MKHQIIVCTNHKTGTQLFKQIFKKYCSNESMKFGRYPSTHLNLCLFLNHSNFFQKPTIKYKGIHIYRHPYEIIMSGVRYHQITNEKWCAKKKLPGKKCTYKQHIRKLSIDDKISFEMKNAAKRTIMNIYNWDWDDDNFKMIKLEDVNENTKQSANEIASFLNLNIPKFIKIFDSTVKIKRTDKHNTNKTKSLYTFQNHFKEKHYQQFREIFPANLLQKLGYQS